MKAIGAIRGCMLVLTVQVLTGATRAAQFDGEADGRGRGDARERGDVPGWVLITIMTAGLVTLLWGIAGDTFQRMFTAALAAVTGPR